MHGLWVPIEWWLARSPMVPVCALALGACATAPARAPLTPGQVTQLEARVARDPADAGARVELAAAYLQSDRNQQAATLLEGVVGAPQHPAVASYYLGVAYEALGRAADARRRYGDYLTRGASSEIKQRIRRRLAVLDRRELEMAVAAALAREQTLLRTAPDARVVGVFPYLTAAGEQLTPLGRALAELLTTDLRQTDRLRVVERAQLQHLLNEIRLAEEGAVDAQTAARAGRLLGAGRIVQGRIDGTESVLRIQSMVVAVPAGRGGAPQPITHRGPLSNLFDMQKTLVLAIYRALGVELTVAERQRVNRRPTQNVQALLAFGLGLEAEDAGRHAQAVEHFRRASALDPGFTEARTAQERTQFKLESASETTQDLVMAGAFELAPPTTGAAAASVLLRQRLVNVDGLVPGLSRRDPLAEILRTEGIGLRGRLQIVIIRPPGSE